MDHLAKRLLSEHAGASNVELHCGFLLWEMTRILKEGRIDVKSLNFIKLELMPAQNREAPVRFSSVTVRGWNSSSSSGFRFRRFLCKRGFSAFQYSLTGKDGSGFGFLENGSGGSAFGFGKAVLTVPVPGSGSVPEPPCQNHSVTFLAGHGEICPPHG